MPKDEINTVIFKHKKGNVEYKFILRQTSCDLLIEREHDGSANYDLSYTSPQYWQAIENISNGGWTREQ